LPRKQRLVIPANAAYSSFPRTQRIRHSRESNVFVIPANAAYSSFPRTQRIRHSRERNVFVIPAKAGIQCLLYERHWIPTWPFLETSPFGLVFAGMTSAFFAVEALIRAELAREFPDDALLKDWRGDLLPALRKIPREHKRE
jgi:hypothetical protein